MSSSSFDRLDLPLRTDRLVIRASTADDADAVWRYRRLDDVSRWLTTAPTDAEAFGAHFADPERLAVTLLVELPGTGVIGDIMLRVEDAWAQAEVRALAAGVQAELGWAMDPAHQGKGYATEAVRAVMAACFTTLGLRRVHAGCFAANEPSWRMMERLGMRREEHSRGTALHRSGEWMDGMNYGILAEEWRSLTV
ncbi:GNAT family N-acetyltransferase [Microbacterium azadirachtae]|uniref:GNAT family N-acetyltransferase n=1 Tax=Microbacterium azadirachtae TaxID=582680 RepID=UPI0021D4CBF9|nr:GNAT family protein [Microbacterium azadirachtae]UXW86010.1 GNAT family N-acetyltransferase [Microbacterium azadirachtae]